MRNGSICFANYGSNWAPTGSRGHMEGFQIHEKIGQKRDRYGILFDVDLQGNKPLWAIKRDELRE